MMHLTIEDDLEMSKTVSRTYWLFKIYQLLLCLFVSSFSFHIIIRHLLCSGEVF